MRGLAARAWPAASTSADQPAKLRRHGTADRDSLHSGLSGDFRAVLFELIERDQLPQIFFAGYSMGGNLILKMAGELGAAAPRPLRGVCGVRPRSI